MKFSDKLLGFFNLDLGEVFLLADILGEVKELNGSILEIFKQFIMLII